MTQVEQLTHDEIAELAAARLKALGYIATFSNVTTAAIGEKPDAFGIKSDGDTFLVEVKVSRNDFIADKKKPWRNPDYASLGHQRAYLTPKGLLSVEDIPYGWQLWEVHGKKTPFIKIIKGEVKETDRRKGWRAKVPINCDREELNYFRDKASMRTALGLMATILARMEAEGINTKHYAQRHGKGYLK